MQDVVSACGGKLVWIICRQVVWKADNGSTIAARRDARTIVIMI
jgi:hypothetical protein